MRTAILAAIALLAIWTARRLTVRHPVPATMYPLADRDSDDGIQAWA